MSEPDRTITAPEPRPATPAGGRWVSAARTAAGLLSAGTILVGLVLLVSHWLAPALLGWSGLDRADGARFSRALPQLAVGLIGEIARGRSRAAVPAVRLAVAGATIAACLVALWWGWWS